MRTDKRVKRERQARRHNEALIIGFRNFAITPKNGNIFRIFSFCLLRDLYQTSYAVLSYVVVVQICDSFKCQLSLLCVYRCTIRKPDIVLAAIQIKFHQQFRHILESMQLESQTILLALALISGI